MNVRSGWSLLVLAFTMAFATDARAHSGNTIDGVYTYVIERPYQGASRRVDMITADDGHRIKLDLSAASLPPEGLAGIRNRRIRVAATDTTARAEAMGISENFRVRSVQVLSDIVGFSRISAVTGNQKYISILCKFSDKPAVEPRTPAYFTTQLNNTYPGFNHFFREVSYNTLTLDGSQADVAWVTLPMTRVQYNALGAPVDYLGAMFDDCTAAANATVDFSQYFGINMMFNDKVDDTSAWGGSWFSTLDGVTRSWPVTWMPYWGDGILFGWNDHGVLAHEMSHAFGSLHSKDPSGFEYGSSWDVVSNPGGTCLVTQAGVAGYGCIGQHPVAYNKIAMGIMPAARIVTHAAGANLTAYNVERMTQPPMAGGTFQVIKAAITGTTSQFYTIESRKRVGYDQNVPGDGVIIHKVTTGNPQPAHLLSPLGTAANLGDIDALWAVGSVFISVPDNIKITVNSFSGDGTANVTVQPATDPGTFTFALAGTTVIEGNTTAAVIAVTRT
ncbi:MAG: hypothetical protein H7066_15890, partial [Cytophagaceae bacterium]|nr:hypothetical protein [Gemmatimonadaceae bacterium]